MNLNPLRKFLTSLQGYNKNRFRYDLTAGLTVAVLLVPQGMAYALLAGMPPIYGLYASIVPLVIYSLMGSSRHLSIGPVAIISILVLSGLSKFAEPGSVYYVQLAITTALLAGLIQVLLSVLRLGFLINFLSHPVLVGFISAAVILISASQLATLLGIPPPTNNSFPAIIAGFSSSFFSSHPPTVILGMASIAALAVLRIVNKDIPSSLIVLVISILVVWLFDLDDQGIHIVGPVPSGLPAFTPPTITINTLIQLLPLSLTISLISFIESLAISKRILAKSGAYSIDANQELFALGLSKIVGSLFQSYPTSGSFSRTVINFESGAQTGISSILTAIFISLVLFFLTPLFYYLPNATLSAIIIIAVIKIIDIKEIKRLYAFHKIDFLTMIATFVLTLSLGVQSGVLAGVVLSLAFILYRSTKPNVAVLGHLPDSSDYRNIERFDLARQWETLLIIRFDAQLYFANADFFRESMTREIDKKGPLLKHFILDASSISDIDFSGMQILVKLIRDLHRRNVTFSLAGCIGPVRDFVQKTTLSRIIETQKSFLNVHDAVIYLENEYGPLL